MPIRGNPTPYITLVLLCVFSLACLAAEISVTPDCSIQLAVDAAPDGATIRLAPGEYEEAVTLRRPITLVGSEDPENRTVLRSATLFPALTIEGDAAANLTGLVVEGARRFRSDAIAVYGSADASLRRVEVRGSRGNGVNIYSSGTTEIAECWIHSNTGFAIVVQTSSATVVGQDNDLRGNGAELGLYAPPQLRMPTAAQTNSLCVRVPTDYKTIQEAIDAVAPGGVVELEEGDFSEPLILWKSVTLRGQGVEATRVGAPTEAMYGGSVVHAAANLVLEGMTLSRPWSFCGQAMALQEIRVSCSDSVGIELHGTVNARLTSVEISDVRGHGLIMEGPAAAWLRGCLITACQVGLLVEGRASATVDSCTFSACSLIGLGIDAGASVTVRETEIDANQCGVSSSGTSSFDRCMFERNLSSAIDVGGGESCLRACAVRGNTNTGLYVTRGSARVEDCVFLENGGESAVACGQEGRLAMIGCTISENAGAGLAAFYNARVLIDDSAIRLNGITNSEWAGSPGIFVADAAIVTLTACSISQNAGCGVEAVRWSEAAGMNPQVASGSPAASELHISACHIFENALDGLFIQAGRRVVVRTTRFASNYVHGIEIAEEYEGELALFDTRIEDQLECGILALGGSDVHVERCTVAGNGTSGILAAGTVHASIDGCTLAGNLIGLSLAESPSASLTDCLVTGNRGYGLLVYCRACSEGDHLYQADLDFIGELIGEGNVIPDLDALNGNGLGGICPNGWEFLLRGSAEAEEG